MSLANIGFSERSMKVAVLNSLPFFGAHSTRTLKRSLGIERFQLIKSRLNLLQSGLRILLIAGVSSAMQVGDCVVQLFQRGDHLLAGVWTQHATVLF